MAKEYKFDLMEALQWQLHDTCLSWELTDRAERALEIPPDAECSATIKVKDKQFVVTFE